MAAPRIYDVIVIGGGAIGLAAAYEVAKSGKTVVVLERNNLFNQAGSSGDLPRMYRTMYTEKFMAILAKESLDIWDELERDAGDDNLRLMTGLLNFGDPEYGAGGPEGTLMDPIENLEELGMPYKIYETPAQIEALYPFKNLPDYFKGVYAPDNGIINVPLLLRTLSRLAQSYGAQIRANHKVINMTPQTSEGGDQYWQVESIYTNPRGEESTHTHHATKVIITAGAYTNHILQPSFGITLKLDIWEMVANYWGVDPGPGGTVFPSMWFQFANDIVDPTTGNPKSQLFYGFPAIPWGPQNLARISVDAATNRITDPDQRRATVISPEDTANVQEFLRGYVTGVDSLAPGLSLTCLQTNVYDNMFVLDFLPQEYLKGGAEKSVAIFTAGWAMKFVPLLGRALRQMVNDGQSQYALPEFSITRHGENPDETIIETPASQAKDRGSTMEVDEGSGYAPGTSYGAARMIEKKKGRGSSMRTRLGH